MRYACRGKPVTGWIAVDYVDDAEGCSTSKTRYGTALLASLAQVPVDATLEVCADQPIPRDWVQVQMITGDARCPSNKPDANPGTPTVREIRRMR